MRTIINAKSDARSDNSERCFLVSRFFKNVSVGSKVLLLIVLCGLAFTMADTGVQIYLDHKHEIERVEDQFEQIQNSYLKSIVKSTWNLEKDEVLLQLEGALKLKDIQYMEVKTETGEVLVQSGSRPENKIISRTLPLVYEHYGKKSIIGSIEIVAGLEGIYDRLYGKMLLLVSYRVLTAFILSAIFLIIFQRLVSRHLTRMARYTQNLDLNNMTSPLELDRSDTPANKKDELGKVVEAINGMQKRIQEDIEEIRQTREDLERSEKKYRNLFESSMDAILLLDLENGYHDCNPAALELFGFRDKEQLMQYSPVELSPEYQADGTLSSEKAKRYFKKVQENGSHFFEWTHKRKDGTLFIAGILMIRIAFEGQSIYQGTIRDITEYKKTQEMMVQSEKMLSVGGLAAGMAHEINNPLAGMLQNASLMAARLTDLSLESNKRVADELGIRLEDIHAYMVERHIPRFLKAIDESGFRIAAIVDNMLSFARKSDSQSSSTQVLSELVDKTLELAGSDFDLKRNFDFKMVDIQKHYDTKLMVPCEKAKIQQVLLNIFRNGAQAMQTAGTIGPRFIIRIYPDNEKKLGCIEVEDNGPGMDEQTVKRVFEPFFTTKEPGLGTGLGLSVSYFIITDDHGGSLEVESSPGQGANFIIRAC